jgi:NADH:ubiquinone oxidoreductase subunit K
MQKMLGLMGILKKMGQAFRVTTVRHLMAVEITTTALTVIQIHIAGKEEREPSEVLALLLLTVEQISCFLR